MKQCHYPSCSCQYDCGVNRNFSYPRHGWNIMQCIKFGLIFSSVIIVFAVTVLWHITPNMVDPKPEHKRSMNTTVVDMEREILSRKIY